MKFTIPQKEGTDLVVIDYDVKIINIVGDDENTYSNLLFTKKDKSYKVVYRPNSFTSFTKLLGHIPKDNFNKSSNVLTTAFVRFYDTKLRPKFIKNGGIITKSVESSYIQKIDNKYLLVNKHDVIDLETMKKTKKYSLNQTNLDVSDIISLDLNKEFTSFMWSEFETVFKDSPLTTWILYLLSLPIKEILYKELKVYHPLLILSGLSGKGKSLLLDHSSDFISKDKEYKKDIKGLTAKPLKLAFINSSAINIFDEYKR